MAITANISSVRIVAQLNNGYDTQGNVKTVNLSMPTVDPSAYVGDLSGGRQAVVDMVTAFDNISSKSVYRVAETTVAYLEE